MTRVFACFVALLLFGGGVLLLGPLSFEGGDGPSDDPPPAAGCDTSQSIKDWVESAGFRPDEYALGGDVDWSLNPLDNTQNGFSDTPLESAEELKSFFARSGDRPRAARRLWRDAASWEQGEVVPVQFLVPAKYSGNAYWRDGVAVGGNKRVAAGDGWLFYVDTASCEVVPSVAMRVDCGNIGFRALSPFRRE